MLDAQGGLMRSSSPSSLLRSGPDLYLVPEPTRPAVRLEARASAHQRVVFVHGERSYVLGAVSESATIELYEIRGAHVVLCVDRGVGLGRIATARIRMWSSRDHGASWTLDPHFDVASLHPGVRSARIEPSR
jgi:hypothetical protein